MQPRGVLTKGITWIQLVLHVLAFNRGVQAQERAHTEITDYGRRVFPMKHMWIFSCSPLPQAAAGITLLQLWEGKGGSPWLVQEAAHPKRQLTPADGNSPGQGNGDRIVFFLRTPAFPKRGDQNRSNL